MYFNNSLNEVKNILHKELCEEKARLSAWESVVVKTKKNGEEYANLASAISGGTMRKDGLVADAQHPYIYVFYSDNGHYMSDNFGAFWYLDDLPVSDPRRSAYKPQFVRQTTPMTAQELREAIAKRIETIRESVEQYEADISAADEVYNAYREAMHNAEMVLKGKASNHFRHIMKNAITL